MSTPHISAEINDFAKTVLMPGDPLRAKYIAETYLTNARLVTDVRGMLGYTGEYKNVTVSVMGSGMGMPSMGIYSYELYNIYGVENIIRIGSAGALTNDLDLFDIVAAIGACTNTEGYGKQFGLRGRFAPTASYKLLKAFDDTCAKLGTNVHIGNVLTSDTFYVDSEFESDLLWNKMGVLAVEMESAALYTNAARAGKNALAVFTISDSLVDETKVTTAEQRQKSFNKMITAALETAVSL